MSYNIYFDLISKQINGLTFEQNKRNLKFKNKVFYYSISRDYYFLLDNENNIILNTDKSFTIVFDNWVRNFMLKSNKFNGMNIFDFVDYLEERNLYDRNSLDTNFNSLSKKLKKIEKNKVHQKILKI